MYLASCLYTLLLLCFGSCAPGAGNERLIPLATVCKGEHVYLVRF
jgi:hypothetical protein